MNASTRVNNIYKCIKETFSVDALLRARRLEQISLSQVRNQQHLRYLHICKEQDHLPPFLLAKPPINHPKVWAIARKTGWSYLCVLISNCHHKLINLSNKSTQLTKTLSTTVDQDSLSKLDQAISSRCGHLRNTIIERHEKKSRWHSTSDSEHNIMNKWVINLSNNEIDLLRKGLNFVGTPRRVPKKEILASVEQVSRISQTKQKNDIRAGVFSILKHAKPLSAQNLNRGEKKAIKDLRSEDTIIITKADKGNAMVIMDKAKYTEQVNEMLGDQTVYTRITDKRRNPTKRTETDLENILKEL